MTGYCLLQLLSSLKSRNSSKEYRNRVLSWFGGVSAIGRTPLVFIGVGVKINAVTYQILSSFEVVKILEWTCSETSHFCSSWIGFLSTLLTVSKNGYGINSGLHSKGRGLSSSSYLNHLDFCVWSIMETKACSKSHKSIESLRASLVKGWDNIPQETLRITVEAVPKRLNAIVRKKIGYIE